MDLNHLLIIKMLSDCLIGIGYSKNLSQNLPYTNNKAECKELLKNALSSAGLGEKDINFPLKDIIKNDETILIKPNWVNHRNYNKHSDTECLITNNEFIELILDQLEGCCPKKVLIADAPIQGCNFDMIASNSWFEYLKNKYSFSLELIDFRQTILERNGNNVLKPYIRMNPNRKDEDFLLFDLGTSSSLEEISKPPGKFRVTMYDHRELNRVHYKGKHQYLIAKELFEVDVVINVPKLKTHKKAGMTGALKNLVGVNGSKNYLPHHRIGGSLVGGDNYRGFSVLKRISEYFTDRANMRIGQNQYVRYKKIASYFSTLANRIESKSDFEGGWYGNDTVWRMVLDLNKIILYGNQLGELSPTPLRRVYSITDAIIAGDTEGPLSVEPVNLGMVTFSSSSVFADLVHTSLMQFDWKKIPTIREAFNLKEFPIVSHKPEDCRVILNGKEIQLDELADKYGKQFRPPKYWKKHIEIK
jgi:uncharacterized protein (DUF362 family)